MYIRFVFTKFLIKTIISKLKYKYFVYLTKLMLLRLHKYDLCMNT